jgi:hypothetical protein
MRITKKILTKQIKKLELAIVLLLILLMMFIIKDMFFNARIIHNLNNIHSDTQTIISILTFAEEDNGI